MTTRREFFRYSAAMGLAALPPQFLQAQEAPLSALGARRNIKIGVAAQGSMLSDPTLSAFIASQFNLITPGKEFGWAGIHPAPDRYNYKGADWMLHYAESHQMQVHGHTLCWNEWNPAWLNSYLTPQNAEQTLRGFIQTVLGRYRGRFVSWDVVNEPIRTGENNQDGLNGGPWLTNLGPDYIRIAFEAAAEADPGSLRVLNVDTVEQDDPVSQRNRTATLKLIEKLVAQKVPVQAVGFESHLSGAYPARSKEAVAFAREIQSMGLEFLITELDINDTKTPGDEATSRHLDAEYYKDYLQEMLPLRPINIIFWTPTDRGNYYDSLAPRWPVYRRADNSPHHPGLLDVSLQPNPALAAVRAALQS